MASVGHIMDLSKEKKDKTSRFWNGIDLSTWDVNYSVSPGKKDVVSNLKDAAKKCEEIYIATDDDREGEAIAFNILDILPKKGIKIHRVIFKTITQKDILDGIKNPIPFNDNLYAAQQARRITDRLVGFKVSPIMWTKGLRKTSAGRVQSAALKFIVDREREIRGFKPEEYWTIKAKTDLKFDASFYGIDSKKYIPKTKKKVDEILKDLSKDITVASYVTKQRERSPEPPFITASMQKDAGNKFGWTGKKVMDIAQNLFSSGLITYHRCFPGYVRISTSKGLIPIRDIKIGEGVHTINGIKNVTDIVKNKNRDIFKLNTKHGYQIFGSNNEPFMIYDCENRVPVWKRLDKLRAGDLIALSGQEGFSEVKNNIFEYTCPFESEMDSNNLLTCNICNKKFKSLSPHIKRYHKLTGKEYVKKFGKTNLHTNSVEKFNIPKIMTPDLAKILGYILSEGCISKNGRNILFYNNSREVLNDFAVSFNKIFGTQYSPMYNSNKFEVNSKRIVCFLSYLGMNSKLSIEKEIPHIIFKSDLESKTAFIKAFWEGDGSYDSIITNSEKLKNDLKLLLLSIGIPTGCHINREYTGFSIGNSSYKVQLSGFYIQKFFNLIGEPISKHRMEQKEKLLERTPNGQHWSNNKLTTDNVIWDKVIDSSYSHKEDTWDLTVEEQHHYIAEGFIAHNTDSIRSDPAKIIDIRDRIEKLHGKQYLSPQTRKYASGGNSQDAHESIRPTFDTVSVSLGTDERKLLELITNRFMSSQMADAIFDQAAVRLETTGKDHTYEFRANGSVQRFDGFLKVYGAASKDNVLPALKNGQKIGVDKYESSQHHTEAPARYTDPGTFTDKMEKEGIGRPATYASTMDTLIDRNYVEREKQKIKATEVGIMVSDYLTHFFKNVTSSAFTATMETELDEIAEGKRQFKTSMDTFFNQLTLEVDAAKTSKVQIFKTDIDCSSCNDGTKMIKKISDLGVFLGCDNWPKCGHTVNFDTDGNMVNEEVDTGYECPICGNILEKRKGPYGEYYRCKGSACSFTGKEKDGSVVASGKSASVDLGVPCPKCKKGTLLKRESAKGPWVGCSEFKNGCKFTGSIDDSGSIVVKKTQTKTSSGKTTNESCPLCKTGKLIERKSKFGAGTWLSCDGFPKCRYKK